MKDMRLGKELVGQFRHPLPHQSSLLAAPAEYPVPKTDDAVTEGADRRAVCRHRVIGLESGDDLPVSGIGLCIRCRNASLISRSFARMRSRRDFLLIRKSPRRVLSQMSTKPRNLKVSGLERPRLLQFWAAKRPNSIRRVFAG